MLWELSQNNKSFQLLVTVYGNSSWSAPKAGKEQYKCGLLLQPRLWWIPTAFDNKNYYAPNEIFKYSQVKFAKGSREKLFDVNIVHLEDLGIN